MRQPIGEEGLRETQPRVRGSARHHCQVELPGRGIGLDPRDFDHRLVADLAKGVPSSAGAPVDERYGYHNQQDGQDHEDRRRGERGPGLAGHT
jgi:hypothetical protein